VFHFGCKKNLLCAVLHKLWSWLWCNMTIYYGHSTSVVPSVWWWSGKEPLVPIDLKAGLPTELIWPCGKQRKFNPSQKCNFGHSACRQSLCWLHNSDILYIRIYTSLLICILIQEQLFDVLLPPYMLTLLTDGVNDIRCIHVLSLEHSHYANHIHIEMLTL
jgi:hypothetical protein